MTSRQRKSSRPAPATKPKAPKRGSLAATRVGDAVTDAPKDPAGPLESSARRAEAKTWAAFRRRVRKTMKDASLHGLRRADDEPLFAIEEETSDDADTTGGGESAVRKRGAENVAARLMLAKAIDGCAGLADELRSGAPVVAVDVADPFELDAVECCLTEVMFGEDAARTAPLEVAKTDDEQRALALRGFHLVVKEPPKSRSRTPAHQKAALAALAWARPVIALSPAASTHLPDALLRAGMTRVTLGSLDARTLAETIRIVTGESPRTPIEPELAAHIGLVDIAIAVRFDRSAAECLSRLRNLAAAKIRNADARDLTLDQIHGMKDAVCWGKAFVTDVEALRRGDAVRPDGGVILNGPSGTGKTTLIRAVARQAKVELLVGSYARWQSAGDGHLGHFLRAMAADFALARKKASESGIVMMFVDEIDSFANRSSGSGHSFDSYMVAATNGFIFFCDGISGGDDELSDGRFHRKPNIILVGATNDARRCDPAVLRSGRFNRVIDIGLPDHVELEAMMRVRLKDDLRDADLMDLALMAGGATGADVERIVNDARRLARHAGRDLTLGDLKQAFGAGHELSPARRARVAVHEAGHIMVGVLLGGPDGVVGTMAGMGNRVAGVFRTKRQDRAGTFGDHFRELQVLLAGRVAETATFGSPGEGAGGIADSDLAQATRAACAMIASFGLAGPPLYLAPAGDTGHLLRFPEVRSAASGLLSRAEETCARLIAANHTALDRIAARLLADGRIDGPAVARIVGPRSVAPTGAVDGVSGHTTLVTGKDPT